MINVYYWNLLNGPVYPSCLQATLASEQLQEAAHTPYQLFDLQISSRPCFGLLPTMRRSSVVQARIKLCIIIRWYNIIHDQCALKYLCSDHTDLHQLSGAARLAVPRGATRREPFWSTRVVPGEPHLNKAAAAATVAVHSSVQWICFLLWMYLFCGRLREYTINKNSHFYWLFIYMLLNSDEIASSL